MMLTSDDTSLLIARRLSAQCSLKRGGSIMLVSQPDSSGSTRALSVSPEWLFLFLEAEWFRSVMELRGQELSHALQMKANTSKLLLKWLDTCAGSSGRLH